MKQDVHEAGDGLYTMLGLPMFSVMFCQPCQLHQFAGLVFGNMD